MLEDLYNAATFLGSWRWPELKGDITAVDVERIKGNRGNVRLRLAVAFKFSVNGDGPYTGESLWNPAFCVNRRVLEARRRVRVGQSVRVRYRTDDPSVNRIGDWASLVSSRLTDNTERHNAHSTSREQHVVGGQSRRKRRLRISKSDGWVFALVYLLVFLAARFDIHRSGSSFQHAVPAATAAWLALLVTTILFALQKIRYRYWR